MPSNDQEPVSPAVKIVEEVLSPAPYRKTRIVSVAQGIAAVMEASPPQAKNIPQTDTDTDTDTEKPLPLSPINVGLLL